MAQRLKIPAVLQTRASFEPSTFDEKAGTVEVVFTTGARGLRRTWMDGTFYEELEVSEGAVDLSRLNNGAPLLDNHDRYSGVRAVLGVIEKAWIQGKEGRALVRFSEREDVKPVKEDVKNGILRHTSVGYSIQKLEKVEEVEKVPVYRATRWTPAEISLTPVGFDDKAVVRAQQDQEFHEVEILSTAEETRAMPEPTAPAPVAATPTAAAVSPSIDEATRAAADLATRAERERAGVIRSLVSKHKLGDEFAARLLGDEKTAGMTVEQARAAVLDELARRDEQIRTEQHVRVEGGEDLKRSSLRAGMVNALLHRTAPGSVKLEDVGRQYATRRLYQLAEDALEAAGVKTRNMSPMELAGAALGIGGLASRAQHATSDFPLILADVANKTLRRAYEEAPQTFQCCSRRTTLPDFKPVKRNQLGEAPQLKKVLEGGEFTRGSIGEGKEQFALATYGRVFAITRQAIVNDDLDAFSRIPALFGRSARDLESDLVWEQITSNPTMADGVALFHANHGNLAGANAAIAVASIGLGRAAMRQQKGIDKKQFINVTPKHLIVPTALETVADQFVSQNLVPSAPGSVNPFAGRLTVVAEPRLDAASATAWYLCADPAQIDIVEYAYLVGEEGPALESRVGFDVDGLELKCRHDFAAKVIDHRGIYKNIGV